MNGFLKKALEIGAIIKELKNPTIVTDYDCDGMTSAAIVSTALDLENIPHSIQVIKKRSEEQIKETLSLPTQELIFCDFGAGFIEKLEESNKKIVVIDHHPPSKETKIPQINPHLFGFNGASDACSASCAYFCFRENKDLSEAAIVGAVGDMQDNYGINGGLVELNQIILKDAIENEIVLCRKDLKIFGRVSRPLIQFLAYSTEPYLPGLTGNEKACAIFLNNHGIPLKKEEKNLSYYDLNVFQRRKLSSALIQFCYEKNLDEEVIKSLIGDVYLLIKEPPNTEFYDAYEFATLLQACGRYQKGEIGIKAAKKDEKTREEAKKILLEHRNRIKKGIEFAAKKINDLGPFYLIDCRGEVPSKVIGSVTGLFFNSGLVQRTKPIISFAIEEDGNTKVSSRGTKKLVQEGLDLGKAMNEAAKEVGSNGGGHAIAAGAWIPKGKEKQFLIKCKEIIQKQLKKSQT